MTGTSAAPSGQKIFTARRRELIEQLVDERESVTTEELAERFGVSHMTIYRDLKSLESRGALRRVHGGAIRGDPTATEPVFARKRVENSDKKERIARYAARTFVDAGDVVILEGGTTSVAMIKYLDGHQVSVITNGVEALKEAAPMSADLTVLCCGGIFRRGSNTLVGPTAVEYFRHHRARTFFLSATGLVLPEGITDPNPLEIQVKLAMADAAQRLILLLDSSKFGRRSLSPTIPLDRIECVVTDPEIAPEYLEGLEDLGVDVRLA